MPLPAWNFGDVVGAGQCAVLAAEALVVEMLDDPRDRVLLVGIDRASIQASRVEAVVARRGYVLEDRQPRSASDYQPDVAPGLPLVEAVQRVASGDARLASRAAVEIDLEGNCCPGPGGEAGSKAS